MAIEDDVSVALNGDIRWTGTTATYTVLELHRFLQDLADNASSSGDDLLDITSAVPSERKTDEIITLNSPYNIDDTLAEHLYAGSVEQAGGDTLYSGLSVVGSVISGTQLQIVQNNTLLTNYWGTGLNADAANNILLRILVKTRDSAADIDGKRLRVQSRELGARYAEFSLTAGEGISTAAIFTSTDLNNQTAEATIAAMTSITVSEGLSLIDVNGDSTDEEYFTEIDKGTQTINDVYERMKWIQRRGTSTTIFGMNGELFRGVTHSFAYDGEASGPFTQNEVLTFGNGATAALLALDDDGATGNMYVQLLTGTAPSDNDTITGGTSSATANVNGTVTARTISAEFVGSSTGSAIIGAYGVGIQAADLSNSDQLFDLSDTLRVPPNNVTFTVSGIVSGEDYVLVTANDGSGGIDTDQLSIATALTGAAETAVVVSAAIPTDTPTSGTLRIITDSGIHRRVAYTSYTGSTFTIASTDFSSDNVSVSNNAYISYIDKLAAATSEAFTSVFLANRDLIVRVRDGGSASPIKPFESPATLTSAGGSTTAIRTSDA